MTYREHHEALTWEDYLRSRRTLTEEEVADSELDHDMLRGRIEPDDHTHEHGQYGASEH
jgi:hypothetical protein